MTELNPSAIPTGPACVVCHDAGGAEILASYIEQRSLRFLPVLEGPAVQVFRRRLGCADTLPLAQAVRDSAWCLLGTSWQSDLEWRALEEAARAGKRTVSFLDHWVNYAERFVRQGVRRLPDELWVGDERALQFAARHFPGLPITLVPNPYFIHVREVLARLRSEAPSRAPGRTRALFICENISGHAAMRFGGERHWGYTELDAIEYFFARRRDLARDIERVVLRPHPSDPPGKYAAVVDAHRPLAVLSSGKPLLEEIEESDLIAGCESVALVAAAVAGKRVLCCIPPQGRVQFIDQQPGVQMLRDLPAPSLAAHTE